MLRRSQIVILGLLILVSISARTSAEDDYSSKYPFGKTPGGWYLGGTAGLSGIDSVRGLVDSLFYAKAASILGAEMAADLQRVIYGDDDRRDVYTVTDPHLLRLTQAACAVISTAEISNNGDGTYTLSMVPWTLQGGLPLCAGERFAGQQRIGFCSGFLVAPDLVVTAGHCLSDCNGHAFLFGFQQVDSLTPPPSVVSADDIYFCSQVVAHALQGDNDYCLVRLDRPVVGREPIPIRRDGLVSTGAPLVVVGDPLVLPMKVAAGAEVKDNRPAYPWFQANTDTYGGNSGSMVVNMDTWRIEGILVRGAPDFVYNGGCAASNVVPNTGNPGPGSQFEEISKIGVIAQLIPELVTNSGEVRLDHPAYACDDTVGVELRDLDLAGTSTYVLSIVTSAADSELVNVSEEPTGSGTFFGTIVGMGDTGSKLDGRLQMTDGASVTVFYHDNDDGTGSPADVEASSSIDCRAPLISGMSVSGVGVTWVKVAFQTDEPAQGRVRWGFSCGDLPQSAVDAVISSHLITLGPLLPATSYYFVVEASDGVGNLSRDDNAGACYEFTTLGSREFYTEQFLTGCDLQGKTLAFIPDGSTDYYRACVYESADFLESVEEYTVLVLSDDSYERVTVSPASVSLYGRSYSAVYIGSNGFVTFSYGNSDYSETIDEHFASPPRISVFWDDLDPTAGGQISYRQFPDRFVVTWENIPERSGSNQVSAQLRLFFDGMIDITYRLVEPLDGIVGLSEGAGTSMDFIPSDFSHYAPCQSALCFIDNDADSFGAAVDPGHRRLDGQCGAGYSANNFDCDDTSELCHPGANDLPDDAIDQNCDGVDATCCQGLVGDVNGVGGDRPTISDVVTLVDHLFVTGSPIGCRQEADVNQSGGRYPALKDITISDVSALVDFLFVNGTPLKDCL